MCENSDIKCEILTNKKYIDRIVDIHMNSFNTFFLTFLGRNFLKQLYLGYLYDDKSGIIVAYKKNELCGFIAYSNDYSRFYKRLLMKRFFQFAFSSFFAFLKKPSILPRLLSAFHKSNDVESNDNYVELASIAVSPKYGSKGIGTLLIKYLINITDFSVYSYINLETDGKNNDKVNSFYKKMGFSLYRTYTTKQERIMNEYRFRK